MKRIAAFLALILGMPLMLAPSANATSALWDTVKADYEAVTYDSLFSVLNPYVSNIERTNITNALKTELGKQPTETEINNRVQQIFMQRLGMKAAFDTVKTDLATKIERITANSSVTEAELKANAKQIIFGLTYLQRYYSFKVTENKTAQDLLLFETQTAFGAPARNTPYNVVKQIGGIGYLRAGGAQTAGVYSQIIAPATAPTVSGMINKLVAKYSPQVPVADWFTRTSQALFVEKGEAKFFAKAAADQRLESHLLPLLALSSPSIFVLSTDHSVTYGLTAGYGGATASDLQQRLESTATQQQNFWDFWHRISTTANKLAEGDITIVTDAMLGKPNTPGATFETRWSPKDGAGVDPGVREFMLPLGLYRDYQRFAGEASTASKRVSLIISEALSDDGINTFTHEMTHIFDDVVWFNGHPIRSGIGGEAYARGFFESLNNTQKAQGGNSSYAPIFNLNTAYQLGAGRVQNASPQRFQTPNDLQQYMRGVFDVIYTLEVMEANSTLKLSAADKALAFNTVSLIPDAKEQNGQKEAFRHLSAAEAGALTTINQLVDNAITSSRIMPQGLDSSAKTLEPNGYYVIPLYQPFYAGLQNNPQAVGDYSFRRHSYELLAEYGWENGLVAYASGKYPHDEAALQAIMPGYNGDMKSFKKAMYAQRAEKIEQLKPAAEFADGAAMQAAMDVAVRSDIARLKSNQSSGASFPTAGVTAIDTLKDRIFRSYLTTTGDFKSSIYREVTTSGVRELWVANGSEGDGSGAGTYDRPYQNLETALARAQAGDVIRLKENVTVAGTGLVFINKAVTIDASVPNAANGEMFTLRFRGRDIQLGANATLKNVNLVFLKDNREPGVIYQAGHELTLDNVNTLVGRLQSGQRPVIYTGVSDETGVIGQKAVLNVVNPNSETRLAKIYVGDLFQDSNIPAEINLAAKNIKIDGGIVLGSENDTVQLAAVKIQSKSDFLNTVTAVPAGNGIANREIIFDGVNLAQVSLSGVHNVTLKNNSRVKLASSQGVEIPGTVTVSAGNTFDVQDNQVQFGHLAGAGTVRIGSAGKVAVAKGISTTAQFIVYRNDATWEPLLGREYISAGNLASSLRVSLEPVAAGFKVGTDSGRVWTLRRDAPELPNVPDEPDVPEVPTPPTPAPIKKPSFTQWTDLQNSADCQARTVTQTRVKTTYTYVWNEQQKKWDEQSSRVVEKQTRAMTDGEVAACAPKSNSSGVDYVWVRRDIGSGWASAKFTHVFNAGDLDGNGYEDMMLTDVEGKLWFYPSVSETAFRKRAQVGFGWNNMRQIFGGIDFNGDAKIDILGIDKLGNLYLYAGLGNGYFAKKVRIGSGWASVQNISVAQNGFNGNPIIMGSKSGVLSAWQTDGKARFVNKITYGSGWNAAKLTAIAGDVSGDGLPDMWVVMKSGELRLYVTLNANGTRFNPYVLGNGWKDVKYFLPRTKNARIIRAVFPDGILRQYTLLKFEAK